MSNSSPPRERAYLAFRAISHSPYGVSALYLLLCVFNALSLSLALHAPALAILGFILMQALFGFAFLNERRTRRTRGPLPYLGFSVEAFTMLLGMLLLLSDILAWCAWPPPYWVPLAIALILTGAGAYSATHPHIKRRRIAAGLPKMRLAMVSDIHFGCTSQTANLRRMVDAVNAEAPDIVLLCGDLCDLTPDELDASAFERELRRLRAPAYAVLGNHEYANAHKFGFDLGSLVERYERAGLLVLLDSAVLLNNGVCLIGRNDYAAAKLGYTKRAKLCALMPKAPRPTIVLDHHPTGADEASKAGANLQLSGHTHAGQFFPFMLLMRILLKYAYGEITLDKLSLIVSSGYGTWGPPVRLLTRGEIAVIDT